MILYFTYESCDTQKPFLLFLSVKTITKLNLGLAVWFTISGQRRIWTFHVLVLQRMAKKYTKKYDARARPLFCLLNLLTTFLLPSWFSKLPLIFSRERGRDIYGNPNKLIMPAPDSLGTSSFSL